MAIETAEAAPLPEPWFAPGADTAAVADFGLRAYGGGGHQSKTIMVEELGAILGAAGTRGMSDALVAVEGENLLGKASGSAGKSAVVNLNKLYGLKSMPPVARALVRLWDSDSTARPLLALLCALARDPLLRDTAEVVAKTPIGASLRWPEFADAFANRHPNRFSPAMLKSLSQNCASSWTQSGHLSGFRTKRRARAEATPEATAFAALIAQMAGFGGPALLSSPWLAVLDAPDEERLGLLRRAQGRGLVRVRHAGAVFELMVSPELTAEFA